MIVLGDIHWSAEMEQAWKQIQAHPRVQLTLDLFDVGLVFFNEQPQKQHFILEF